MDTLIGRTAGEGDLGKRSADGVEPVDAFRRILSHFCDQVSVIELMAAFHCVLDELLDSVLDSLFFLIVGLSRVHASGGLCGIAARVRHLLEQDDVLAGLCGIDGSRHTCAARAYDHNVCLKLFFRLLDIGLVLGLRESAQVSSRSREGLFHRAQDGIAGDGRSGESVDIRALGFQNTVIEHINREGTDIFGLVVSLDLYILDLILGNCYSYGYFSAEAGSRLCISTGDKQVAFLRLGAGRNFFAAGLGKSRGQGCFYCVTCIGSTGYGIHVRTLGCKDSLFQ